MLGFALTKQLVISINDGFFDFILLKHKNNEK